MTELGERFIAALRAQGFGYTFDDDDLVIQVPGAARLHHVPMVILLDADLEILLRLAIVEFAHRNRRFSLGWLRTGRDPGMN